MTHVSPTLSQVGYRGYADTGGEGLNPKANENTGWTQAVDENFRVRFVVDETAGGAESNVSLQLQYNLGGAGWNNAGSASSVVRAVASGQVTDEGATTRQLTSGSGAFVTGAFDEGDGIAGSSNQIDFSGGELTEVEYVLQLLSADVDNGNTVQLRVIRSGGSLDAWTQTPTLTVSETVTVTGTGTTQAVTATASGSGVTTNAGSGSPQAATATASGAGTQTISGSGSAQAATATATGSGTTVETLSGSGSAQAQAATASGAGSTRNSGTGTPQSATATASGQGVTENSGSGATQAEMATATGSGTAIGPVTGSGSPQALTATATGSARSINRGSGSAQASVVSVEGNLITVNFGSGAVQAARATGQGGQSPAPGSSDYGMAYRHLKIGAAKMRFRGWR